MSGRVVSAEEARTLIAEATDGPWRENSEEERDEGACGDVTADYISSDNDGRTFTNYVVVDELRWNREGDGRLIAAAPDLAHTVVQQAEKIAAALALHQPREEADGSRTDPWCAECDGVLPCPTMQALGVL